VQAAGSGWEPLAGVVLGLLSAVVLGYLLYKRAVAINLKRFFTWTGAVLVVVAAGVLTYGIGELQEIGWLPGGDAIAFDVSGALGPDSFAGTLLRGVLNIHPVTSWLQAIGWLAYLIPVMYLFLRPVPAPRQVPQRTPQQPATISR
jgi:high-affinity iron transporter